jgi:hypothetical protein
MFQCEGKKTILRAIKSRKKFFFLIELKMKNIYQTESAMAQTDYSIRASLNIQIGKMGMKKKSIKLFFYTARGGAKFIDTKAMLRNSAEARTSAPSFACSSAIASTADTSITYIK